MEDNSEVKALTSAEWEVSITCVPKYSNSLTTTHNLAFDTKEEAEKCYGVFNARLGDNDFQTSEKKEKAVEFANTYEKLSVLAHEITSVRITNRHRNLINYKADDDFMGKLNRTS